MTPLPFINYLIRSILTWGVVALSALVRGRQKFSGQIDRSRLDQPGLPRKVAIAGLDVDLYVLVDKRKACIRISEKGINLLGQVIVVCLECT